MNFTIRAITLDLDDTLWPFPPIGARIERVLDDWLRTHSPRTAERFPIQEMRALRERVFDAHPHLLQLSERVEETVDLAVLRRGHMVFIDQIAGPQRLRAVSAVGQKFPLHCTANGKAALALLEDEQIDRVLERSLERHTPATITDPVVLRQELGLIRQTGIAFDREEHSPGICAVGAAFRDPMAMTYAIAVPMPSIRFEETRAHVAQSVLDCAHAVLADVRRASAKSV